MDPAIEGPIEANILEEHRERTMDRRQVLKTLIAAGGASAILTLLPDRWVRPVIEAGVLPSHAQVSYTPTPSIIPTCYTPTVTPPLCYTPTPSVTPLCYTPTPTPRSSTSSREARRLLRERLLTEERFPQDIARELR